MSSAQGTPRTHTSWALNKVEEVLVLPLLPLLILLMRLRQLLTLLQLLLLKTPMPRVHVLLPLRVLLRLVITLLVLM